ncbi:MAG: flavin reductase family protein [Anaerolineae bacterium]
MSIDANLFKLTLRRWVSGVTVVTASDGIKRAGVTASSFTSVSAEPPLVLISLQNHISTLKLIEQTKTFAISILSQHQTHLSIQFAGFAELPEGADRFYEVPIKTAVTGAPIIEDSSAWLDCRLFSIHEAGSSKIVIGEVKAASWRDDVLPLAYHNRNYYDLIAPD